MIPRLSSAALALALTISQPAIPAASEPDFASMHAATARYHDVNVAIAEGYVRDPMSRCDAAALMGWFIGMGSAGVHYFRPDLVGAKLSPTARANSSRPGILVYQPRQDGSLELVAVENLKFRWAWRESGRSEPANFHAAFYQPMTDNPATKVDEAQMFEPRYERRVWIFSDKLKQLLVPYNGTESCPDRAASAASAS